MTVEIRAENLIDIRNIEHVFGVTRITSYNVCYTKLLRTKDIALSLIFGSVAPASAPAGTVAVIHEYKAKGNLTKALYAIVGFDDGLGIIIFGFAAAIVITSYSIHYTKLYETEPRPVQDPLAQLNRELAAEPRSRDTG